MGPVKGGGDEAMTATVYRAKTDDELVAEAQRVLDEHVTSSADGRCLACNVLGPCWRRENAVVTFSRKLRLPLRRPGVTRPELVNLRRIA
jgi:hypothetical protein